LSFHCTDGNSIESALKCCAIKIAHTSRLNKHAYIERAYVAAVFEHANIERTNIERAYVAAVFEHAYIERAHVAAVFEHAYVKPTYVATVVCAVVKRAYEQYPKWSTDDGPNNGDGAAYDPIGPADVCAFKCAVF
jgi:hypothetical protein